MMHVHIDENMSGVINRYVVNRDDIYVYIGIYPVTVGVDGIVFRGLGDKI